jgi:predicted lipoprotein with Yx(FWY)xxD motif
LWLDVAKILQNHSTNPRFRKSKVQNRRDSSVANQNKERLMKMRVLFMLVVLALAVIPAMAQDALEYTVNVGGNDDLGTFLVNDAGMTLYVFDRDTLDTSNCAGPCLERWPALTVESADALTFDPAIVGEFGTIEREDGALQVTFNGWPLYTWANDAAAGDATGQGVGRVWWVAAPATVYVAGNEELGRFLVGANGMTLYTFSNDEAGVSNCAGDCATAWPPYTVESEEDLAAGFTVPGELGTIEREDGSLQVTYNGWPLYYWQDDAARGDATGQGVGEVWYVVAPETVSVVESDELGAYLVAPNGLTLYTFSNDEAGVSNCADDCATAWPPYTVGANDALVVGAGAEGELATIERADGSLQVTYNGMPLYYWQDDAAPGDTLGQGLGDVWFVAAP